ncbi:MAG: nucleoside triphosphate pyrophosphohydrolase [Vampirovibrio sp.]|nr:nucleoside triphosphate pyrophosphohydrolase [Vampirovibrio sp.]
MPDVTVKEIQEMNGIAQLLAVIAQLRHPTEGCPWDLKQTHQTLKPYLLEEAYEVLEAIDEATETADTAHLCEELGDLLLQVVLHAQIAQDNHEFDFTQICSGIAEKLIRRHPHVFGEVTVDGAEAVTRNWEQIKREEKAAKNGSEAAQCDSILEGISVGQPALSRAGEISKKAVRHGFKWPNFESLWACVMSEYDEFREAADQEAGFEQLEDEMGDILFATVSLAQHFKVDPEVALTRATNKFIRRFQAMEQEAPKPLEQLDFEEWDTLWKAAKQRTQIS